MAVMPFKISLCANIAKTDLYKQEKIKKEILKPVN